MPSLPKLLITGGNGQIARALLAHPDREHFEVWAPHRAELDITDWQKLTAAFALYQPDVVINTAAYTAVDKAESETALATVINQQGAENLARATQAIQSTLIHLSTDYVFNGKSNTPYLESDPVDPINHYGRSKCLGEEAVRQNADKHIILRVSGVFSPFQHNFVKTILRLARERETLTVVADQLTCPTDASGIAQVIYHLATCPIAQATYHYSNQGIISWYEFATCIVDIAKAFIPLTVKFIHPVASCNYQTAAKRPAYSCLNSQKIAQDYTVSLSHWQRPLEKTIIELLKDTT